MSPASLIDAHSAALPALSGLHALGLWTPPLAAGAAGLAAAVARTPTRAWRAVEAAAAAWCVAALAGAPALAWQGSGAGFGVRADLPGAAVLLLVGFVGWAIVRFARTYLAGEGREQEAARWLAATLAGVGVVIVGNHLLLMAGAWLATSAALQQLLMFYGERPAARLAAHKKRVASRLADACVFVAVTLIGWHTGTFAIDGAMQAIAAMPAVPAPLQGAAVLLAAAAVLKCAQLPFHGWLIQVMEAPTPVSALLHAGVVNLGALVLIRMSPLMSAVPAAQTLLLVVGGATAVLAALVMSTRISVKVMLAWSTCAQLGFMLMQCGLGAWGLALVHLLAHSLYKAHAFLDTGGTVQRHAARRLMASADGATVAAGHGTPWLGLALLLALGVAGWTGSGAGPTPAAAWLLLAIGGASLAPLVAARAATPRGVWALAVAGSAATAALALLVLHGMAEEAVPTAGAAAALHLAGLAWVAALFVGLYALQAVLARWPEGRCARALYPWIYGGLFLDEWVSRWIFRLWPPVLSSGPGPAQDVRSPSSNPPWMPPLTSPERPS